MYYHIVKTHQYCVPNNLTVWAQRSFAYLAQVSFSALFRFHFFDSGDNQSRVDVFFCADMRDANLAKLKK